jgi:hypothetical protein
MYKQRDMKKLLNLLLIFSPFGLLAQSVAINNDGSVADNSAILDIKSNSKGLLIPRLTTAERTAIASPLIGLTVYDSETFSFWNYRGDIMGGWVELLHSLDKHWNRTGSNIFTTNGSGNVGIGTNSPAEKLTINATDPTISFLNSNVAKGFIATNGNNIKLGTYNANTTGNLILNTRDIDRLTITSAGNFGMGISNPVGRFQIGTGNDASATSHGYLMMGPENGENLILDNNEILARNNGVVSTLFLARDGSKVQLGNGAEGTGTKLHITSGNEAGLPDNLSGYLMMGSQGGLNMVLDNNEIQVRSNGAATHLSLQNEGGNVYIGDVTNFNSAHRLGVDGNTVITGNVRIGNTVGPSGYRLAVDGKAICTELLVRLVPNWPDYVFNKNYKLPGLHEVEDYINKHHHLPGIPSAKELDASGLNIGEMQKLQMEKIEELTLYIIELKKEIEKLSAGSSGKAKQ